MILTGFDFINEIKQSPFSQSEDCKRMLQKHRLEWVRK